MKFSIIVPVFNVQDYLEVSCKSVFQQSYQDYELILVDDGSTDDSGKICDDIARNDPARIKVLHTKNQGPLLAKEAGLRMATGDVIVFLDSDDCICNELLQKLYNCFTEHQCDMVLYNASTKEDFSTQDVSFPFESSKPCSEVSKSELCQKLASGTMPNSVCMKASNRNFIEYLPDFSGMSHVRNGDDLLLSLYMVTGAEKIYYLNEMLYFYRQREGSIVHTHNPNRLSSIKTVHQEMERFIDLWEMPELHAVHYAHEVKSWIDAMLIAMENRACMRRSQYREQLRAMAENDYFRYAYSQMDVVSLPRKHRLLAAWLYRKHYFILQIATLVKDVVRAVKNNK